MTKMQEKMEILLQQAVQPDYWLFYMNTNRFWLTNFKTSDGIILFDVTKRKFYYFLDERYWTEAHEKLNPDFEIKKYRDFWKFWNQIQGKINVNHAIPTWLWLSLKKHNPNLQLQPLDFSNVRMIKTASEIAKITMVCQKTTQIWQKIVKQIKTFKTEQSIANFIHSQFTAQGCQISFEPIVASGERTAFIHTQPTANQLTEVILCDFGGKLDNYCSDFTRTIVLNSKSPLKLIENQIYKIYQAILTRLKPGVKISSIVKYAQQLFKQQKWELKHALGHGIGLQVHEAPMFTINSALKLQPNMVITIEPGVYLPQLGGIRYEDTILITQDGYKILTLVN